MPLRWARIFQILKAENCQPKIMYPAKLSFVLENEINTIFQHLAFKHLAFKNGVGPGAVAQVVKVLALHAQDPIWAPVLSRQPRFPPAPCLWPGKAVEDGPKLWEPAPAWETQKRLLASDRHSIGSCAHLGSETLDGRSSSLSLLSVYPPFQ